METIPRQMLVNVLSQVLPPHLASRLSNSHDLSFAGLISGLTFQEFEAVAEYLRGAAQTSTPAKPTSSRRIWMPPRTDTTGR
jgi:hypothetical protein